MRAKIWDIAFKDVLRSLRNMFFLAFGLGVPLLMAAIFYFAFGGAGGEGYQVPTTSVIVVNLDEALAEHGDFSAGEMLLDFLSFEDGGGDGSMADLMTITEMDGAAEARVAVDRQEAGVALIIPADFSAAMFEPDGESAIEMYSDPTLTLGPGIVKGIVGRFVDTLAGTKIAANVALARLAEEGIKVGEGELQDVAMAYANWAISLVAGEDAGNDLLTVRSPLNPEAEVSQDNGVIQIISLIMGGMTVFYAFFTGASSALTILQEEEDGTLARLFTTPTTQSTILGGKFIAIFILLLVQLVVLLTVSSLIFQVDWGAPLPLVLSVVSLIVISASFGLFVTSWMRDTQQAGVIYGGVMTVMGMIGISSVFTAGVPNVSPAVKTAPLIVPQGWAMRVFELAMDGAGVDELILPVAVVLLLSVVFFAVGVQRFKKRFA
ncbi:MAG TPA: hypothetical protein ENN19_04120 [Chloroflexi bacterium]|nr:hypothetical protein [Chloroflexota bacterium]